MEHVKTGLTSNQAAELRVKYGPNTLPKKVRVPLYRKFVNQLKSVLIYLLFGATALSFVVGDYFEGILILVIVFLNASIGVYQEEKAADSLELLENSVVLKVRVLRDGREVEIDSSNLVPGDIVNLDEGSKIPADGVIVESRSIEVSEAVLTGEALSVPKESNDEVYMGTTVVRGHAIMKVEKTGAQMRFGEITKKLQEVGRVKTPLQIKIEHVSKVIGAIGLCISVLIFAIALLKGVALYGGFLLAISLAVAIVPEGLPAVMTVVLSVGVKSLAKRRAIVRTFSSIESLGNITLIATDKTGTITTNKMSVKEVFASRKEDEDAIYLTSVLCSTSSLVPIVQNNTERSKEEQRYEILGDPTEGALLIYAQKMGINIENVKKDWKIVDEQPFDSQTKKMSVKVQKGKETILLSKGAPESLLNSLSSKLYIKKLEEWAKHGYRVIGFTKNNKMLGLVALYDPPRIEVEQAIKTARAAGVDVVMITGDNEKTAQAIARQIGLILDDEEVLTGKQIEDFSDSELLEKLPKTRIFARTSPIHKSRIVALYQKLGHIVAVTGDGVNDVIALKQAHVGIAMGIEGTDVAREGADIVLADDNFATIVEAIEEGRSIVQKLENTVKYLLTTNLIEALSITFGMVVGVVSVFSPLQILYINLISDGFPALSLAFSPKKAGLMSKKALAPTLFSRFDLWFMIVIGVVGSLIINLSYLYYAKTLPHIAATSSFTILALMQSFLFAEMWLSHGSLLTHYRSLRSWIFWSAFLSPLFLQLVIINTPFLRNVFRLEETLPQTFGIFIIISSLVTVAIWLFKVLLRHR